MLGQSDCFAGSQIFAFIHESDPEEICEQATMCDASIALPELPEGLKKKTSQLFDVQDEDECNTCKLVIVQIASALADPVSPLHTQHSAVFIFCSKWTYSELWKASILGGMPKALLRDPQG